MFISCYSKDRCMKSKKDEPLNNTLFLIQLFRPNLFLTVKQKIGDVGMDFKNQLKKEGRKFQFEGPTIIYCPTKKKTEEVTNALKGKFFFCLRKQNKINVKQSRK